MDPRQKRLLLRVRKKGSLLPPNGLPWAVNLIKSAGRFANSAGRRRAKISVRGVQRFGYERMGRSEKLALGDRDAPAADGNMDAAGNFFRSQQQQRGPVDLVALLAANVDVRGGEIAVPDQVAGQ